MRLVVTQYLSRTQRNLSGNDLEQIKSRQLADAPEFRQKNAEAKVWLRQKIDI